MSGTSVFLRMASVATLALPAVAAGEQDLRLRGGPIMTDEPPPHLETLDDGDADVQRSLDAQGDGLAAGDGSAFRDPELKPVTSSDVCDSGSSHGQSIEAPGHPPPGSRLGSPGV